MNTDDTKNIIRIQTDINGIKTVNARDLHEFLEVGKDFSNWIRDRIIRYDFVQHQDFTVFAGNGVNPSGGRSRIEYALTIGMAKELSMVERNEKGKQARRYFIECERITKELYSKPQIPDFTDPSIAARSWADERDQKLLAESQCKKLSGTILEQAPHIKALKRISLSDGTFNMTVTAKQLQVRPIDLRNWILIPDKWIYKRGGSEHWLAYADKLQQMLMEHKTTTVEVSGETRVHTQIRFTPKGIIKLAKMLEDRDPEHGLFG